MRNMILRLIVAILMLAGFSTASMAALAPQYQRAN
jgi:capsular polysaccharide biosynthesis protein